MMKLNQIEEAIIESNMIENINRKSTDEEIGEFIRFLNRPTLHTTDLLEFINVYQPNAKLRAFTGMNVIVGNHKPIPGGPIVKTLLSELIDEINHWDSWIFHVKFEKLHPFTDGNGRLGRMIWYWMNQHTHWVKYGFLRGFYYQTLNHFNDKEIK